MNTLLEGIGNISLIKLHMKKLFLSILFVPYLANCSSFNTGNIAPGYIDTFKAINNAVFGYSQDQISSELIANIPYASILLKIGKGPKGLMILEQKINGELVWISADGIYVVTKNGKIIRAISIMLYIVLTCFVLSLHFRYSIVILCVFEEGLFLYIITLLITTFH